MALVGEADLVETYPAADPSDEPIALGHRGEQIDNPAVHDAEIAGVQRDVNIRDALDQAIKASVRGTVQEPFLAMLANRKDHVVSLLPLRNKLRHDLRRVLEIAVHHDNGSTGCVVEPGRNRDLVTEVSRQFDDCQARISGRQFMQALRRPVTAAIVDENQLVRQAGRLEGHRQALVERQQVLLLVEQRNDHGHINGAHQDGWFVRGGRSHWAELPKERRP
jgi:hypothetical protein